VKAHVFLILRGVGVESIAFGAINRPDSLRAGGIRSPKPTERVTWRRCKNCSIESSLKFKLDWFPYGVIRQISPIHQVIGFNLKVEPP
jgi:hypothetical protein